MVTDPPRMMVLIPGNHHGPRSRPFYLETVSKMPRHQSQRIRISYFLNVATLASQGTAKSARSSKGRAFLLCKQLNLP